MIQVFVWYYMQANAQGFSLFYYVSLPTQSVAYFPLVYDEIRELFGKLQGLQETEKQINSEIIDNINQVKSHLIRAEDARYYNEYVCVCHWEGAQKKATFLAP